MAEGTAPNAVLNNLIWIRLGIHHPPKASHRGEISRLRAAHLRNKMQRSTRVSIFRWILGLAPVFAAYFLFAQTRSGGSRPASHPVKPVAMAQSVPLQKFRNLGTAYFEQGKYVEAIEQFQRVVASGKASAADHLNLGLALMLANRLDAALGEMTTAKQMDPHLVAVDYNLGILYKHEIHNPDAEAA